ncbi:MAG TPA: biopolymer transporter ExbD [Bryobacteraceae bacterium]|jgi:biopolymer transport protein ExbD|nr:biopolymer transporter ExbD [Bryobacteraceae bacterium]
MKVIFKKAKESHPVSDINVTPMVDVMLVLLIIFMVITPLLSKGVPVTLVKTKNPIAMQAADKSDAILVAVTRDARVFLNTNQMQAEDLAPKVKDLLTNRLDKTVFIKADQRAKYEKVVDVVDNLRAAGVDQVGLLTEQVQQTADDKKKTAAPKAAQ